MSGGTKIIWRYIMKYKKHIITAAVFAVFSTTAQAFLPGQIGAISDYIQDNLGGDLSFSGALTVILNALAFVLLYGIFYFIEEFLVARAVGYIGGDIRHELNDKLNSISFGTSDTYSAGDMQSRFGNDVTNITTAILDNIAPTPANAIKFVLLLVLMFMTNVYVTLALIGTTFIGILITTLMLKKTRPHVEMQQQTTGVLNGVIEESLTGHMVVKAFHCEEDMIDEFEKNNSIVRKSSMKAQFLSCLLQPVISLSSNLGYIGVCVTAAILFSTGSDTLTLGGMTAFILYAPMFSDSISAFTSFASAMQMAGTAADRINTVLEAPELEGLSEDELKDILSDKRPETLIKELRGDVSFRDVRFGYVPDQIVLKGLSAEVKAGQKVAIVGPTGAGKSTLVNLLMRFYEPNSGEICIDGVNIHDMSPVELHDNIAMVLQDTWTFQGSIRDNIVYSTEGISEEKLNSIVKDCGLSFFIETLPDGLDTEISENSDISAGQKQLITIARALAKDSPILILDEATSNVDTRSELLIQQAIDRLTAGRTSFVIAHRLSTIKNADCIFVMKDGDVIEMGRHEELIEKGGLYSELYYSQFDPE